MILQLRNIETRKANPRRSRNWKPISHYEYILDEMSNKKSLPTYEHHKIYDLKKCTIPDDATICHKNYMEYLRLCWSDHLNIVITPDIVWFTLLCEIISIVKNDVEKYRHLFSESENQQEITVGSDSRVEMPLEKLMDHLKSLVPLDIDLFMPNFSTTNDESRHAQYTAFADMCSPYYKYSMYCCGIPKIDVRGTEDDWHKLKDTWTNLEEIILKDHSKYFSKVTEILTNCIEKRESPEWWKDIFSLVRCGSGSDVEVSGWFSQLFFNQPSVLFPQNFSTHLASMDYTDLPTKKNYKMRDGLFYSMLENEFMVPHFAYMIHEVIDE